jgi:hypothetical protein
MVKKHDITQIPVEQVQPGFSLLMSSTEGHPPWAIRVDDVAFSHKPPAAMTVTITSTQHLDTGEPVVLDDLPVGTMVTRVLRTYDDGT